ncbi:zinc finger BED domain-containing protein 4-like [Rhizophagus clarus]|uniref:Zinc finger BED domain-containing protein 4-like n=1 Tax=Rhizophagus clarus TaxID=94130 RepID=A0A8H3MAN4_9GLOM|nr:zinc finger BED domain-containing protein 4-like [Rhizophagus clarus]
MNAGQISEYFFQVVADVSTRWNSSYYAWNRLIKIKGYIQMLIVELVNNENDNDAKKDGKQLKKIMLSSDEWELLQQLVITFGPFEEATNYLGGEKYITHRPTSSTSPVTAFNTSEIYQEIENAADVFVMIIEEVEISENDVENNNNQTRKDEIDLNKPLETKDLLNKEILLPTPIESPVESRTSSPTPSESLSVILNPIYKPRLFSIFEQNQPRASNEVEEYLNEDNISFIQCPIQLVVK